MEYKGRLTKQINQALLLLEKEGTIIIPMNNSQYEQAKDYKFMVLEEIHKIQKNINFSVQQRLFEEVLDRVKNEYTKYECSYQTGIIKLI